MIKRLRLSGSLSVKMFAAMALAFVLSLGIFFAAWSMGSYLVENIYMSPSSVSARKAKIYTDFSVYVRSHDISGTDTEAVARWSKKQDYVTIIVIGRNTYSVRQGQHMDVGPQGSELTQIEGLYGKLYPFTFADGNYRIAIGDTSEQREKNLMLAFSFFLAVIAFLAVMLIYIHRVTRRIILLSREATAIGKGDLDAPITTVGADEISVLGTEMDGMRRSVIERMGNERKAWEANRELITAISHDIRTPMTSLIGYLGILSSGSVGSEESREKLISSAYTKAMDLKELTDELFKYFLVFGRAQLEMNMEEYDARLLSDQLIGEAQFDLEDFGFTIQRVDFEGDYTVEADPMYLKRVVDNMVSNLKKYADKSRSVMVISECSGGRLNVCISNYIKKDLHRVESTKIGLRTCEKIMTEMGGSFGVRSDDEHFAAEISLPVKERK